MAEKAPAFQFYPRDLLTDEKVVLMSNTELGIYLRLLCYCWLEGSLPLETEALAKMARMPLKQFTKLWEKSVLRSCFFIDEGRLHNKRLLEERDKQVHFKRRQSDNGKMGGRPKKPTANPDESQKNPGLSETEPKKSSASAFASASALTKTTTRSGKEPPLAGFAKIKVWRWMWANLSERLGDHADAFEIGDWLADLDKRTKGVVVDSWAYIQAEFEQEVVKRGLAEPLAATGTSERDVWAEIGKRGPSIRP